MNHYLFIENTTGEEFIVGADTYDSAANYAETIGEEIAAAWTDEPADVKYCYCMTDEEAEMSGLDEY